MATQKNIRIDLLYGRQVLRATLPSARRQQHEPPIAIGQVVSEIEAALEAEPETAARLKLIVFAADRELKVAAPFSMQLPAFERLIALGVPTAAIVRGSCTGGGLALAAFCNFIFAEQSASFGGARCSAAEATFDESFAVLSLKLGAGAAVEMLMPGGALATPDAYRQGLVTAWTSGDSALEQLVQRWLDAHLLASSAASLRMANRAVRLGFHNQLRAELPAMAQLETGLCWTARADRDAKGAIENPALWADVSPARIDPAPRAG